jgi:hypothetical protein
MSDKLSRRQILRLGGGFAIGAGATSILSGSLLTQPSSAISTNFGGPAFFTRGQIFIILMAERLYSKESTYHY